MPASVVKSNLLMPRQVNKGLIGRQGYLSKSNKDLFNVKVHSLVHNSESSRSRSKFTNFSAIGT